MTAQEPDDVEAELRTLGHPRARWLASGMEADVYALDDDTVARFPRGRPAGGTSPVEEFLALLGRSGLPFAVPAPAGRLTLSDGRVATLQPRLHGRSIGDFHDEGTGRLDPRAEQALVDLLSALHSLPTDAAGAGPLPLLGGPVTTGVPWTSPLRELVEERTRRSADLLGAHVEDVPSLARACDDFLDSRSGVEVAWQHGDVCRENVLVDDGCRLLAVLDWGFLTMRADPVLEMSLTAGFFDMHGPHAAAVDRRLQDLFAGAFGADRQDLLRYRAVYALMGATAYGDAVDGHFSWCAAALRRDDVRAALAG